MIKLIRKWINELEGYCNCNEIEAIEMDSRTYQDLYQEILSDDIDYDNDIEITINSLFGISIKVVDLNPTIRYITIRGEE
jgi:hypothetical protein